MIGSAELAGADFARNAPENAVFVQNAIEWLAQDELLASIRAKNLSPAPLIFKSDQEKNTVKYFNLIGVPVLVILAGGIVMYQRKRKMNRKFE